MYINKYKFPYGGVYIGVLRKTLFIKVQITSQTFVKSAPYLQKNTTPLLMDGVLSSVKRK